ncbi:MAG TPA: hypothetical protein VFC58_14485 [Desulfosporosinus sp.]|nr:hypothetical protein [Desulfosporosinus sp.]
MLFQWLLVLIVFATLIVTFYSDTLAGKKKHSSYFQMVQKPTGKTEREADIPKTEPHDPFFAKLNSL